MYINLVKAPLAVDWFVDIVNYAKKIKATFTVLDAKTTNMYGFNGEALNHGNAQVGALKFITDMPAPQTLLQTRNSIYERVRFADSYDSNPVGFVVMTKDLVSAVKEVKEENTYVNLLMNIVYDRCIIVAIEVITPTGTTFINCFNMAPFVASYNSLMDNIFINLIPEKDITNNPDLLELLEYKAKEGAGFINMGMYTLITPSNVLGINKNDTIGVSNTNEYLPRIMISVHKKKYTVNTLFRTLNLF